MFDVMGLLTGISIIALYLLVIAFLTFIAFLVIKCAVREGVLEALKRRHGENKGS